MPVSLFPDLSGAPPPNPLPAGTDPALCNVFLVLNVADRVLVDTGNGAPRGALLARLREDGIAPESITHILLTHLHPDHGGGLFPPDGSDAFPHAALYANGQDLALGELRTKLAAAGYAQVRELPADFLCVPAPGHTPGHVFYRIGPVTFAGDILHAAASQLDHPEFFAKWDAVPAQAVATRRAEFARWRADPAAILCCAHAPWPGILAHCPNFSPPPLPSPIKKPRHRWRGFFAGNRAIRSCRGTIPRDSSRG